MAWNPHAGARRIAEEWTAQTFSRDPNVVDAVTGMMMMSREAVVDYMTPLGLHHIMGDRSETGSNTASRYASALAQRNADPRTTPEKLLLWFHRVRWDERMPSGRTLWQELIAHYDQGVAGVAEMQARWAALKPQIDARRHDETAQRLAQQYREAVWWRDACIAYFQSVSGLPLPPGMRAPEHTLDHHKALQFSFIR